MNSARDPPNSAQDPLNSVMHVKTNFSGKKKKNIDTVTFINIQTLPKCVQNANRYPGVWMNFKQIPVFRI